MDTPTVEPQAGHCGAHVTGVDLGAVDDEGFELLRKAFLDHHVLAIRGQDITPAQQLAFCARFGEISIHPYVPSIEGHPGIMEITGPNPVTVTWHSDTTHQEEPPAMSILLARTVPVFGNDTMFANQHAAYEALSVGLRAVLDGLHAVHEGTSLAYDAGLDEITHAEHPVVRTHPETGRRALFVNGNYTKRFSGWTDEESKPLLDFLYEHAVRPEFTYRHRWAPGDLLMWDNRSVQHAVIGDTNEERILHRVTIKGDSPR